MFGLGFWEIGIILAILLIVFGPSKLPDLAKGLGKGLREFRKATEEFKSTIEDEVHRPDPHAHPHPAPPQPAAMLPSEAPIPARTNLPPPVQGSVVEDPHAIPDHDTDPQPPSEPIAVAPKPKAEAEHAYPKEPSLPKPH